MQRSAGSGDLHAIADFDDTEWGNHGPSHRYHHAGDGFSTVPITTFKREPGSCVGWTRRDSGVRGPGSAAGQASRETWSTPMRSDFLVVHPRNSCDVAIMRRSRRSRSSRHCSWHVSSYGDGNIPTRGRGCNHRTGQLQPGCEVSGFLLSSCDIDEVTADFRARCGGRRPVAAQRWYAFFSL